MSSVLIMILSLAVGLMAIRLFVRAVFGVVKLFVILALIGFAFTALAGGG